METNTPLWLILGFAGLFALLRAMVDRVRRRFWKQAVRVVSSALWGLMGALLVREWLEVSPRTLWVVGGLRRHGGDDGSAPRAPRPGQAGCIRDRPQGARAEAPGNFRQGGGSVT